MTIYLAYKARQKIVAVQTVRSHVGAVATESDGHWQSFDQRRREVSSFLVSSQEDINVAEHQIWRSSHLSKQCKKELSLSVALAAFMSLQVHHAVLMV